MQSDLYVSLYKANLMSGSAQNPLSLSDIQVSLFGTLKLERNGETLRLPASTDARHLLTYLLLNRQKKHSRTVLLGVFWGESPEPRARKALSQAIWYIRRDLPELLETNHETITISSSIHIWVDIEEFKYLTTKTEKTSQSLEQAVQLYRGNLLEGLYEEWLLLEREHLRELYLQTLEQVIQLKKAEAKYQEALDLSLKLAESDSLRESAHREIMRLYYLLERPKAALRQYKICQELLENELGLESETETRVLAEEIARKSEEELAPHLPESASKPKTITPDRERPISLALIGRENDRAALLGHVDNLFKGYGGMILLEGSAGIGKTRLLQEVARDAEWRGAQVLWGQTQDTETSDAHALLLNALNEGLSSLRVSQFSALTEKLWLQVLKPLMPNLEKYRPNLDAAPSLEPEQERARLAEAMTTFVSNWGEITPLLLLLEDLHWADEETLRFLPALADRLRKHAVLVIGTYRGAEVRSLPVKWEQFQGLDRSALLEKKTLSGLDAASTSELIQRSLDLPQSAPTFEKRIYQETDGNPLFILEVLRTLQDEGVLTQSETGAWRTPWDDSTADYAELPLPRMVEELIARRLERLPDDSRQVLNIAAILGAEVDFPLLSALCELSTKDLLNATRDLVTRQLLIEMADGYRFSHNKTHQVTRNKMDEKLRTALHRNVILTIEQQRPDKIAALAHHATQGQLWAEAIHYHQQAAQQADSAHAYITSLSHYEQALGLVAFLDFSSSLHFDLLAGHEKTSSLLGKREEQANDLEKMQMIAEKDTEKRYRVALGKAKYLGQINQYAASQTAAKEALKLGKKLKDKEKQSAALGALGMALVWQGQTEDSLPPLQDAITLAIESENQKEEAQYRRSLGSALLGIRDYERAEKELEAALSLAKQQDDLLEQAEVYNLLGIIQMERGESASGKASYEQALDYCREIGYLYGEGRALTNLGNLYYFQGELDKTLAFYDQAIIVFAKLGEKRGEVQVRLNRASISLNVLGNTSQVRDDALFSLDYAEEVNDPISKGQALTVLAESERQSGEREAARQHLEEGIVVMEAAGDQWLLVQEYRGLALLDILEEKPEQALESLERALAISEELGMANLIPPMIALRGLAFLQQNRLDEALEATSEAMKQMKPDIEQVYLLPYWHSQVLAALGRHDEEETAIEEAYRLLKKSLSGLPDELQKISLEQVQDHRAILSAWESLQPTCISVELNKIGESNETVEIKWTISLPEDARIKGKVARRHHRLLRLLEETEKEGAIASHQKLADALGVGLRTIERDVAAIL
jgi:predicted ATPase/DNA-binding SARP family transcriptional activator